jgi:two-component system chemotaxis sensor kinase CheA
VENRETLLLDGRPVSLVRLGDLLALKTAGDRQQTDNAPVQVVVVGSAEKRMAFLVDEVLYEQEVLVKPLGRQLSRVRNIMGATVLGNGKVVPLLNVPDLLKTAVKMAPSFIGGRAEVPEKKTSVLVVEDSITARMLLKNILESAGYSVKAAVDGIDAIAALKTRHFDIVVSDVEMPRMNGFDLTLKIRSDAKFSKLPVVLVTALESREDRERGIDVGANAYIVKSNFDQSNLLEVVGRLT